MIIGNKTLYFKNFTIISFFMLWGVQPSVKAFSDIDVIMTVKSDTVQNTKKEKIKLWKFDGNLLLNFSQIAFSNWSSGGDNAIAGNTYENLNLNYKSENATWENSLKYSYGLMKQKDIKTIKTDDRIEFNSKYGRKFSKKWNYSASCNFVTQFFPGYKDKRDTIKRSDFLSPAYIVTSVGMDYRPSDKFTVMLSPVAGKITIVNSDHILHYDGLSGAYGVSRDRHTRYEMGGSVAISAKGDFLKRFNYQTTFNGFSNFQKDPSKLDWNMEMLVSMKVNKLISANLKTNLLYEDINSSEVQIKEFFGIGFSYKI